MQAYLKKVTNNITRFRRVRIEESIPITHKDLKFKYETNQDGNGYSESGYVPYHRNKPVHLYKCIRKDRSHEMYPLFTDHYTKCIESQYYEHFKLPNHL